MRPRIPIQAGGQWTPRIFDRHQPGTAAAFHRLLTDPRIVAAVEQVFEAPARVYYGMVAVVPAQGGKGLEWHQDNQYELILGRALNMFVALDDITPEMAILWGAPRSHRQGLLPSEVNERGHRRSTDPANGIALPAMKKGDVCLFDRFTLHRSISNTSDRHRYAYAAQYMEDKARIGETGKKDPSRPTHGDLATIWDGCR